MVFCAENIMQVRTGFLRRVSWRQFLLCALWHTAFPVSKVETLVIVLLNTFKEQAVATGCK
jgi:hypothetical protein